MDKFKNKYRITSARLQNWDYGSPGLYFITICTKDRQHYFGRIEGHKMILNELGLITNAEWEKTLQIRPDMNLELGEFITMPNHFHAILMIGENEYNKNITYQRDAMPGVSTNKFGPQTKNLSSIIRGFKSSVTTSAKKLNIEFGWQERFHDHIIRNHEEYVQISNYIINNPE